MSDVIIRGIAAYYLNYCLHETHGPFKLFEKIKWLGIVPTCATCTCAWFALLYFVPIEVCEFLAIAGVASAVHPFVKQSNLNAEILEGD